MNKQYYVTAAGIPLVALGWTKYGEPSLNYISSAINSVTPSAPQVADWYKPITLLGVSLASQIFVKPAQEHSPVVNFIIKTTIGFVGYYLPFTVVTEFTHNTVKNFSQLHNQVKIGVACTFGIASTATIDHYAIDYVVARPLNKGGKIVDKTIAVAAAVLSSVLGSKAETIKINDHEALYANQTVIGTDNYFDSMGKLTENSETEYC